MGKIIVTGADGLVASRFVDLFAHKYNLLTPDLTQLDITSSENVKDYFAANHPEVVLHFAAFTDVSSAETQRGDTSASCWQVNVKGTENIVNNLKSGCRLIYISTDMVFPGLSGPYSENTPPEKDSSKVTWYGYSKAQAEALLKPACTLVRICNPVRSHFPAKLDYFRKPLSLFDQGQLYPLFVDQQISICYIDEVAAGLDAIITKNLSGIFHISSSDLTTPYEIISYLLEKTRGVKNAAKPAAISDLNNPVRYPKSGGLKVEDSERRLGQKFSTCAQIIDQLVTQGL